MSTLGSTAFPCSNLQPTKSIHHNLLDLSSSRSLCTCKCSHCFRADLICLPAPSGVRCCWTGFQSPPSESLNSSLIVSLHFPRLQPPPCGYPPECDVFPGETFELVLSVCNLMFTVSGNRVRKSRRFAPTPSCICGFASCRGGVFHGSPFISVSSLILWASPDGSAPANSRWRTPAAST